MKKKHGSGIFVMALGKMKSMMIIVGNTRPNTHIFAQTNNATNCSKISNRNLSLFSTNNVSKESTKTGGYDDENKRFSGAGIQLERDPIISETAKRILFTMTNAIYHKKRIDEYPKKVNHIKPNLEQKRHFLLCKNCYWMASTLPTLSDFRLTKYNKCPNCIGNIDKFLICAKSF
jgi:hypothetical protein